MPQIAGFRGQPLDLNTRDPSRALFRYQQAFPDPAGSRTLVKKMIVCAVRLAPWTDGSIRRHELGTAAGKDAALAALRTSPTQQPILAGYRDAATEADRLFRKTDSEPPLAQTTTADGCIHKLWRVHSAETLGALRHLFAPKKLQVLDGVDRYEALLAYREELDAKRPLAMYSSANYALMCLVNLDDPAIISAPRHRAITTAKKRAETLAEARKYFIVEQLAGAATDVAKQRAALADTLAHQPGFVAVWAGEPDAWKLTLSPDVTPTGVGVEIHRALQKLDPIVADALFIERLLPGATVEKPLELAGSKADITLRMRAVPLDQLIHVAELGQTLPAGSTAFAPPLLPKLVSAAIDPDEDLQ